MKAEIIKHKATLKVKLKEEKAKMVKILLKNVLLDNHDEVVIKHQIFLH